MALVSNSIYGFTNLDDVQVFIKTDDLTDRGDWSSSVAYALNDAALYLGAYYICLTANTNTPPPTDANISDEWSVLVLVRQGQSSTDFIVNGTRVIRDYHIAWGTNANNNEVDADDIPYQGDYATVQDAIDALFATTGTSGVQTVAQQGSAFAYSLYVAGTNYTNSQVAIEVIDRQTAIQIEAAARVFGDGTTFQQGTAYTDSRFEVAAQNGSQFSVILRDQGTNYADTKDLVVSQQGSQFAYDLYVAGTNYANSLSQGGAVAAVAQQGSQLAFILRDQGTNYTDNRFAIAAQNGSQYSTMLRDQGTTYTDSQITTEAIARINGDSVVAQQGSNYSFDLYVAGTNFALSLSQGPSGSVIAQQGSQFAVILRDQGTNYTDAQVAIEAAARASADVIVEQHGSQLAYMLYWQGTGQSGAGIQLADAGTPSDGAGLATARVGNDLPIKRIKAGTNVSIENNGTNVKIGIDQIDTTETRWVGPSVGEIGVTDYAGTVFLDFGSQAYHTISLTGNLHIVTTGMVPGHGISVRLLGDSVARSITFTNGIRFIGTRPTEIAANGLAIVSFSSYSNDIANVVGAYSAETE